MVFFSPTDRGILSSYALSRNWAGRYLPNLEKFGATEAEDSIALLEYGSDFGRRRTVDKIRGHLRLNCELAGLEVNQLFTGNSNLVNLSKVRHLAKSVEAVYEVILTFYEQRSQKFFQAERESQHPLENWIPEVEALSYELQPVLSEMQAQHLADTDPRTIGFVTTQLHYSTRAILKPLTAIEKALLSSYFQLAEEQVCIPWQEVCALAVRYDQTAPEILLIEKLLAKSDAIALNVYYQAKDLFPAFSSLHGNWNTPQITASLLRDLNMFQGYLWLCVLHQNLNPLTVRLLPLCLMVFPTVHVAWEMIDRTIQLLVAEVRSHLTESQWLIVQPYATGLIEMFALENH